MRLKVKVQTKRIRPGEPRTPDDAKIEIRSAKVRLSSSARALPPKFPSPYALPKGEGTRRRNTPASVFARGAMALAILALTVISVIARPAEDRFRQGTEAYRAGDYAGAAQAFAAAAALRPASGTLQNLGNAAWQCGRTGPAVLAWEQALCVDPLNAAARGNLRFARKTAQLESPQLAWYEVVATWLPMNQWVWVASLSFWLAVAMVLLPGVLRLSKASWHQAVAALGLAVFLLSLPALYGVGTRSRLGFVLEKDTPLRLTPTEEAQVITQLSAGDPARVGRGHGKYVFVRTGHATGWVERKQVGLLCQSYLAAKP